MYFQLSHGIKPGKIPFCVTLVPRGITCCSRELAEAYVTVKVKNKMDINNCDVGNITFIEITFLNMQFYFFYILNVTKISFLRIRIFILIVIWYIL